MAEIFRRFYEKFTHHLSTEQKEDVESTWKEQLGNTAALFTAHFCRCRVLIDNCSDFGM